MDVNRFGFCGDMNEKESNVDVVEALQPSSNLRMFWKLSSHHCLFWMRTLTHPMWEIICCVLFSCTQMRHGVERKQVVEWRDFCVSVKKRESFCFPKVDLGYICEECED